jgi:site-specific recombinase XerD
MMTYSFLLKNIQNSIGVVYVSINLDDKEYLLKTPLRISNEMWDSQRQSPKNIYLKFSKKLNVCLNRLRVAFAIYVKECQIGKKKTSIVTLTRIIKKCTAHESYHYPNNSLLFYIDNYLQSRRHLLNESTYRRYLVFIRFLERYEGYICKNLFIEDINSAFVKDFLDFGRKELYSDSTLFRTIYFVRTILNYLEKRGIRTYVYELELPREKKVQKLVTLSEDELIRIKRMIIPENLKAARDWLIISCYTGQRISDFMTFNSDMFELIEDIQCIAFVQQKTSKNVLLPLHPAIQTIITKYEGRFPPKISFNTYNKKIKEIVKLAGIIKLVKARKRKGFRVCESYIPKWEVVSSHIGRRSFASNFYGKIPTALLMETTGHSSEQMFHHYVNQVDYERTKFLSSYFDEAYKRKFLVT